MPEQVFLQQVRLWRACPCSDQGNAGYACRWSNRFNALPPPTSHLPVTTESTLSVNGFRAMIGRKVTGFLIGTNTFTDRTGVLLAVGANYIVINEVETDDILICDFFSIKFVKVYY